MGEVLVVKGGGVGDFLLFLPLFLEILNDNGEEKVYLATRTRYKDFLNNDVEFIDIESEFINSFFRSKPDEKINDFSKLYIPSLWKSRVGEKVKEKAVFFGYEKIKSRIHYFKQLFNGTGFSPIYDGKRVKEFLLKGKKLCRIFREKYFIVHPGSGNPKKNFPLQKFVELSLNLKKEYSIEPVFVLGDAEKGMKVDKKIKVFRETGFSTLINLIYHSEFFIGNDSGITHLSGLLQKKTFAIFGPTSTVVWAPLGEEVFVIRRDDLICMPCSIDGKISCSSPVCLTEMDVIEVFFIIKNLLV